MKAIDIEVFHIAEVASLLIGEGKLEPKKKVALKAVYHDPCRLGRRFGVFDEPRRVLAAIPGLDLVEFPRSRKNSLCCGGGGSVFFFEPEYAGWVTNERLTEAEYAGADAVVTACPICVRLFEDAIKEKKLKIKVFDLAEILDKSL
ncbi:MAG: (Fe-S)-binding protein [Actinobacteria bacterium]|nr:(Fe-S)-binding protein [Actinomycetota bacterium]